MNTAEFNYFDDIYLLIHHSIMFIDMKILHYRILHLSKFHFKFVF